MTHRAYTKLAHGILGLSLFFPLYGANSSASSAASAACAAAAAASAASAGLPPRAPGKADRTLLSFPERFATTKAVQKLVQSAGASPSGGVSPANAGNRSRSGSNDFSLGAPALGSGVIIPKRLDTTSSSPDGTPLAGSPRAAEVQHKNVAAVRVNEALSRSVSGDNFLSPLPQSTASTVGQTHLKNEAANAAAVSAGARTNYRMLAGSGTLVLTNNKQAAADGFSPAYSGKASPATSGTTTPLPKLSPITGRVSGEPHRIAGIPLSGGAVASPAKTSPVGSPPLHSCAAAAAAHAASIQQLRGVGQRSESPAHFVGAPASVASTPTQGATATPAATAAPTQSYSPAGFNNLGSVSPILHG